MRTILRVDASARHAGSLSRQLGDCLMAQLQRQHPHMAVTQRDLAQGVLLLDEGQITARETPGYARTAAQRDRLQPSDALITELKSADILVLTTPIYNFSLPGALKAYIDQVCRPDLTFRYSEAGPIGLLSCRAYLVVVSGGTPIGSAVDFATPYLEHILDFMGIGPIERVAAGEAWRSQ
ncbi:MAG: NAD(P)H-dependent oxidoreductase [Cyanobacteria bacterium P01_A01_bin.135]